MPHNSLVRFDRRWLAAALVFAAACGDQHPTSAVKSAPEPQGPALQRLECRATVRTGQVSCGLPQGVDADPMLIGGQGVNVQLASSNIVSSGGVFSVDVTVQNLIPEALGTPDGVTLDTTGIRVFFLTGPSTTVGSGSVTVANADGTETFTAAGQPYFQYSEVLSTNEVSGAKTWQFAFDAGVESFAFTVAVSAEVQPLLVINELLANPGGTITDASGEWFEVYNAGKFPVEMQGMLIADSAASGRRPYHVIASPLTVPAGGYVVLGNTTNTTNNGGVPVDYAYGSAMAFANSLDALKISRAYGASDTLTIDRTQYASAAISAQNGISRELKNPALDNSNMDGSNWADALVTAVYGPGGRGTPKAQNSTFTP